VYLKGEFEFETTSQQQYVVPLVRGGSPSLEERDSRLWGNANCSDEVRSDEKRCFMSVKKNIYSFLITSKIKEKDEKEKSSKDNKKRIVVS
jgi:hypothetical protein